MAMLKLDLVKHLLGDFMDKNGFSTSAQAVTKKVMASHAVVRSHLEGSPGESVSVDMATWAATAMPSTISFIMIAKDLVYGNKYDPSLRSGVKGGKGADVVITYSEIQEECMYESTDNSNA